MVPRYVCVAATKVVWLEFLEQIAISIPNNLLEREKMLF